MHAPKLAAVLTLLATALGVAAQGTTQPPPPAPTQPSPLDTYLNRWEQEMSKVQTIAAQLVRVDKDTAFKTEMKYKGYAQYQRSGTGPTALNLAMLELRPDGKEEIAEKFICTGAFLYVYNPPTKEVRVYELPKPAPGQAGQDNVLTFLFGMRAAEAKQRYDLKLLGEDKDFIYIEVLPRLPQDKGEFKRARLVLWKDSFMPRQLWFESAAAASETTWDIPLARTNVQLTRTLFDPPTQQQLPMGWTLKQMEKLPGTAPQPQPVPPQPTPPGKP